MLEISATDVRDIDLVYLRQLYSLPARMARSFMGKRLQIPGVDAPAL